MELLTENFDFDSVIPFKDSNIPPKGKYKLTSEQSIAMEERFKPIMLEEVKRLKIEMKALGYDRT